MAKTKAKLSLKKETLRALSGGELRAVAGGTLYTVVKLPAPQPLTGACLTGECQSGIIGGGGSISCVRVATRCSEW